MLSVLASRHLLLFDQSDHSIAVVKQLIGKNKMHVHVMIIQKSRIIIHDHVSVTHIFHSVYLKLLSNLQLI